jgi:hypothetical protein
VVVTLAAEDEAVSDSVAVCVKLAAEILGSEERACSPSSLETVDAPTEADGRPAGTNRGSGVNQQAAGNG